MSFTVPSKHRPGDIVLVRQAFEGADCLAIGIIRNIQAVCLFRDEEASYSYTICLSSEKEVSVPEAEIFYSLSGFNTLYRHELIDFFRKGIGPVAHKLDEMETEYEKRQEEKKVKTP